jgi:hypothetical protein
MPSFPIWLAALQMVVVLAAVLAVVYLTHNAVGLLALIFLPKVPFLFWDANAVSQVDSQPELVVDGRGIGFTAELEPDDSE